MGVLLTINEAAELEGLSSKTFYKRIGNDKLHSVKVDTTNKKGRGYEYRIHLEQLSEKAQRRYYANKKLEEAELISPALVSSERAELSLQELTESQRIEITFWREVLSDYRLYIANYPKQHTKKTKEFAGILQLKYPEREVSERTLRRKLKLYRDYGEAGLVDLRKQNKFKGISSIHPIAESAFLQYWLTEKLPRVSKCIEITADFLRYEGVNRPELLEALPLPAASSFYRLIKNIPYAYIQYFRYGNKKFENECGPYLDREYEHLESNEVWLADYHTLDFFVRCDITGKVYRPNLIAWMDLRSRKILAIGLENSANSDGNCIAFRKAVERYGIPAIAYLDNGREFLVYDFAGRGIRGGKKAIEYGETILERLGVKMRNALPGNPKAKAIERAFQEVCEEFSKFVDTYCGGTPTARPEGLTKLLKNPDNIPLESEVYEWLSNYIEGIYNEQKSNAKGLHGRSRNECYAQHLYMKKTATQAQLDLMLLRNARLQEVRREGVYVKINDVKIYFYDAALITGYMKHKVYVRYNPEDLSVVHVYDEQEKYIGEISRAVKGDYSFGADANTTKAIKELARNKKKQKTILKDYMEDHKERVAIRPAMEIIQQRALENIAAQSEAIAKVIQPIQFRNNNLLEKAVGDNSNDEPFDRLAILTKMNNNAKRGGENENSQAKG